MYRLLLIFIIYFYSSNIMAQGTCSTALPFCTGSSYTFPASINTSPPPGSNFGCLGSQPNPAFYFMEIANPGNLTIYMTTNPQKEIIQEIS